MTNIKNVTADQITKPVTFAYCDAPEGFAGDGRGDGRMTTIRYGQALPGNVFRSFSRDDKETIRSFYKLDGYMSEYKVHFPENKIITIFPLQNFVTDPNNADEIEAITAIAKGWSEDTGCKIILIKMR